MTCYPTDWLAFLGHMIAVIVGVSLVALPSAWLVDRARRRPPP